LAAKAFAHTAAYDALISNYLRAGAGAAAAFPERLALSWRRKSLMRYGENPHQSAALYVHAAAHVGSVAHATQLQGKPLSFNNLVDADTALQCVKACGGPACVIVKHANPCGVAVGSELESAYKRAYASDPASAYGGVIAFNRAVDESTASAVVRNQFAEVIIAPAISELARDVFAKKPNVRVLECGSVPAQIPEWDIKSIEGGILIQDRDSDQIAAAELKTVTKRGPSDAELTDLLFAWQIVRFVKSNAIVFAQDGRTLGIGAGQMSRVMSTRIAAIQAGEQKLPLDGAVMASDAFFPFRDGIDVAAKHGIRAVIQPGGSVRDDEVIAAADDHDIAMVFTGRRHFRH
jgi:phosphoribosylaminoimidazolecarboxamide formyltransferase/IMP cyclohydrolase